MGIIEQIIHLDKTLFFLVSITLTFVYDSKQWKQHVFKNKNENAIFTPTLRACILD